MLGKGLESLIPKKKSAADVEFSDSKGDLDSKEGLSSEVSYSEIEEIEIKTSQSIEENFSQSEKEPPFLEGPIFQVEVDKIVLNPYQPRKHFDEESLKELAASIREFGILQPLVVSKIEEETESGTRVVYQLIAGQRRLMAAKLLGLKTVPVIIRGFSKKNEVLEMAIIENIQRADLNPIETARAYARLADEFGLTQREIAARLGKSRGVIANALRLLELPSEIQEALSEGKINESHARLLLQINDAQKQKEIFDQIVSRNLSVREARKKMREIIQQKKTSEDVLNVFDLELKKMEDELSDFLGAPVKIEFGRGGGKIVIHFYSPEEAAGIVEKIKPNHEDTL